MKMVWWSLSSELGDLVAKVKLLIECVCKWLDRGEGKAIMLTKMMVFLGWVWFGCGYGGLGLAYNKHDSISINLGT